MKWCLIVVLICISLLTNNDEHLFMDLVTTSRFSLEKTLFKDLILFCINFSITSIFGVSKSRVFVFFFFNVYLFTYLAVSVLVVAYRLSSCGAWA